MKHSTTHRPQRAFTLIEMLVVIAIIATLAGILLPVLSRAQVKARVAQAQAEMRSLAVAITAYQAEYTIYPSSDRDAKGGVDITYTNVIYTNADIVRILLDNDAPNTVNEGHKRNPKQHVFLNVKIVNSIAQPGVGLDFNFRDPWGSLYVVTLDLNHDNKCEDKLYGPAYGPIPAPVLVWSYGPDRRPFGPSGNPRARDNDDIRTW
jgi:prepilin-type N-terminal cleavage/methylation domain-containing protein